MNTNTLPLAIAGMADPISYILGKSPHEMSDVELQDLVGKARELGASPQAVKAALGNAIGTEKRKKLNLAAKALDALED